MEDNDKEKLDPGTTSPGNEGSRGSRGAANRGAQPQESTNEGADAQQPDEGKSDLRGTDARGGGGDSSASSRAKG
jgi:hypothetical protein